MSITVQVNGFPQWKKTIDIPSNMTLLLSTTDKVLHLFKPPIAFYSEKQNKIITTIENIIRNDTLYVIRNKFEQILFENALSENFNIINNKHYDAPNYYYTIEDALCDVDNTQPNIVNISATPKLKYLYRFINKEQPNSKTHSVIVPSLRYLYSYGNKKKSSLLDKLKNDKEEPSNMILDTLDVLEHTDYEIHYSYLIPESYELMIILNKLKINMI